MQGQFDEKLMAFRRNSILSTDTQVIETLPLGTGGMPMKTTVVFASAQTTTTATIPCKVLVKGADLSAMLGAAD